jgi:hypothetical protein
MSESLQLLFILKECLPCDLAKLIMSAYVFLPQKLKPGQIVLKNPCGHLSRLVLKKDPTTLFYPNGKVYYKTAQRKTCPLYYKVDAGTTLTCTRCDRYRYNYVQVTNLELSIICFCNNIADKFPCGTCSAQKCSVELCINITSGKTCPAFCKYHTIIPKI